MHAPQKIYFANRSIGEWLVSLPTILILLTVLFIGTGEYIHSQLLKLGESQWDQYFILRGDIPSPDCQPDINVDAEVNRLLADAETSSADELDMLSETIDPASVRQSVERSRDMCREKWSIAKQNQERVTNDVRAYRFIETGVAKLVTFLGQQKQQLLCWLILICAATTTLTRQHIALRNITTRRDYYIATTFQLVAHATLLFAELSYRAAEQQSAREGVQVQLFELHAWWIAGFGILTLASIYQLLRAPKDLEPGGNTGHALLSVPLYAYMAIIASLQFWIAPAIGQLGGGQVAQAPYYQGIGVYLSQMMELSGMFLSLSLYIWIGMLLKQTRVTEMFFDVIRPWHLSPELMCFVVLLMAAWATAYTGASGIFVIAAGTILYAEFLRSGARRGLALASTAMSGSMGVVLAPCLLVVIIAALNKNVTTGEIYHFGFLIYLMTAFLFLIVTQIARTEPARIAPIATALPESLRKLGTFIPYIVIIMATLGIYTTAFDQKFDEFSAPYILPVILLATLLYDKTGAWVANLSSGVLIVGIAIHAYVLVTGNTPLSGLDITFEIIRMAVVAWLAWASLDHAKQWDRQRNAEKAPAIERRRPLEIAMREGTNLTTGNVGALLILMALSVSVGGVIERSHMMDLFPQVDSVWGTMTILLVVMVIIGMIMDPFGATILVNATIAQVAFAAGIDPLHFWMFALLSFELGYLTPPVALNHLLTRHLVGDREIQLAKDEATAAGLGWWYRHERYVMPLTVMFIALIVVAYGPLLYPDFKADLPAWVQEIFTYTKE